MDRGRGFFLEFQRPGERVRSTPIFRLPGSHEITCANCKWHRTTVRVSPGVDDWSYYGTVFCHFEAIRAELTWMKGPLPAGGGIHQKDIWRSVGCWSFCTGKPGSRRKKDLYWWAGFGGQSGPSFLDVSCAKWMPGLSLRSYHEGGDGGFYPCSMCRLFLDEPHPFDSADPHLGDWKVCRLHPPPLRWFDDVGRGNLWQPTRPGDGCAFHRVL